jgi:hypothetical protein
VNEAVKTVEMLLEKNKVEMTIPVQTSSTELMKQLRSIAKEMKVVLREGGDHVMIIGLVHTTPAAYQRMTTEILKNVKQEQKTVFPNTWSPQKGNVEVSYLFHHDITQ